MCFEMSPHDATDDSKVRRTAAGFTLVELLVVIAIIGILMALIMPAVQSARESGRRTQCKNNMRQIGMAWNLYHAAKKRLPPGWGDYGVYDHGMTTYLLPYIEETALYQKYDFKKKWNSTGTGGNSAVTSLDLPFQLCPSSQHDLPGNGDYGSICGPGAYGSLAQNYGYGQAWHLGVFIAMGKTSPSTEVKKNGELSFDHIRDGLSKTLALGECAGRTDTDRWWGCGANNYGQHGLINVGASNEIRSDHPGGAHVAYADSTVHFWVEETPLAFIKTMSTRAMGDTTDWQPLD